MTTEVFAKFESKGKPRFNREVSGPTQEVILHFAKWMQEVHMGSHIQVTMARSASELRALTDRTSQNAAVDDMLSDLQNIMSQEPLDLDTTESEAE